MKRLFVVLAAISLGGVPAFAQNLGPTVVNQLPDATLYAGAPVRSLELEGAFQDGDLAPVVRFTSVFGPIDVALYERQKPKTVANFLRYVDEGRYFMTDPTTKQPASTFIHRSVAGFVIQGGGYIGTVNPNTPTAIQPTQVATFPAVQNEPGISNKRATIAMAKLGNDPNSATSQWFFNLADNSANLDAQNGGFTVFGRVIGSGMDVVDRIAALPAYNFGSPFDSLPVRDYVVGQPVAVSNLASFPQIARNGSVPAPLTFTATSSDGAVVEAKVSDTKLLLTAKTTGTAQVTITARDIDGATVSQSFNVNAIAAPGRLVNISTRLQVRTGEEALFAGFIMRGDAPKRVMIRAIGPSLSSQGISDPLVDPQLQLFDQGGVLATNDNWASANRQDIVDTGLAPQSATESAILTTLPSSTDGIGYTAVVRGANNALGVAVVEVYDLDSGPGSTLLNIASRGRVGTVDERAMIGGFFVGGTEAKRILIRGLGPSLANSGVNGTLADPKLELKNSNGDTIDSNNDWESSAEASEIRASSIPPTDSKEAAVLKTLPAGSYTAIVRTNNNTAGVGSVEIYQLP